MKVHGNAALGPAGRLALVEAIESGMTLRAAAAALNVAPATAHRWWHRWREAGEQERRRGSWLCDRSSRPHRQPKRLSAAEEEPILRARRETGLGPGRLAGLCRRARSTIWKVLHRHGLSQRRRSARESYRRYEWSRPGALLHVDVARLARFERPGHAVTGDRTKTGAEKRAGWGYVYLHCVIDDHSRYAYVEQHRDQGGNTAAAVLARAIEHFAELGMKPPVAVMSDNAFAYRRSTAFRAVLERHRARHILTPPYTPRWNGKVERFIQTLKREWAYAHAWPTSAERARSMPSFLRYYNRRRPHSSLGDRPPISRVHNVRG
ncbi:MAG TPA: IS481 family transposase [Solirubrobacterales bacterium]|nr:IS481 family transposase [Solirubrobacterales bacterium]